MIVQTDMGSAPQLSSRKYLITARQAAARLNSPSKILNIAIFDNLEVRKSYLEINGQRNPRDGVLIHYEENNYIEAYKDLKIISK